MRRACEAIDVPKAPPKRPLRSPNVVSSAVASSRWSRVYPEPRPAVTPPPRAGVGAAGSGWPVGISRGMARPESAASLIVDEAIGSVQLQNQYPDPAFSDRYDATHPCPVLRPTRRRAVTAVIPSG